MSNEPPEEPEVVSEMQRESSFSSYQAITIRIPPDLFRSLETFCEETNIKRSVLLRRIVQLGWNDVVEARAEAANDE